MAEEDAGELRSNPELRSKVWNLVSSTLQEIPSTELEMGGGGITTDEDMMNLIDQGNAKGGSQGRKSPERLFFSLSLFLGFLRLI